MLKLECEQKQDILPVMILATVLRGSAVSAVLLNIATVPHFLPVRSLTASIIDGEVAAGYCVEIWTNGPTRPSSSSCPFGIVRPFAAFLPFTALQCLVVKSHPDVLL